MRSITRPFRAVAGVFTSFWRGVDQARRFVVNVLFLLVVFALLGWLLSDGRPKVPERTALVVRPEGLLVEQLQGAPAERALLELLGQPSEPETLVRPVVEAIERAAEDERVEALLLDLESFLGGGLSKLQEVGAAIDAFRESGKTVIATADFYARSHYYLAARADEVFLHPMGVVLLQGYGSYFNYYKEALDKLSVDWHVFRVGEYKSAVEPYIRNDMSPEARENRRRWLGELWAAYRADVAAARGLEPEVLQDYADRIHLLLEEEAGDAAEVARAAGLVDRVAHRDELRERLIELVGEDEEGESFQRIGHEAYLRALGPRKKQSDRRVAVVVASGPIVTGSQPPGIIGGDSTARLIRRAREDESVKAIVLRVDSGGGSSFASELIRREVEVAREEGKPVVASMGSVAASGGYWISMSADEIWASPNTITGSIGIYASFPTFSRTLERLGVRNDGIGTTNLSELVRPDRALHEDAARAIRQLLERGYHDFITKAAAGRKMTAEEIDRIGRGQVWSGTEGQRLGLVDRLGGLEEAAASAAALADLGEDWEMRFYEPEVSLADRLVRRLLGGLAARLGERIDPLGLGARLRPLVDDALAADGFGDPFGLVAHCSCEID